MTDTDNVFFNSNSNLTLYHPESEFLIQISHPDRLKKCCIAKFCQKLLRGSRFRDFVFFIFKSVRTDQKTERMSKLTLFLSIFATVKCKYHHTPMGVKQYVHEYEEWAIDTTRFFDETTFSLDPLNELDENLSSGHEVIRRNQEWLSKVQQKEEQAKFINEMIQHPYDGCCISELNTTSELST